MVRFDSVGYRSMHAPTVIERVLPLATFEARLPVAPWYHWYCSGQASESNPPSPCPERSAAGALRSPKKRARALPRGALHD